MMPRVQDLQKKLFADEEVPTKEPMKIYLRVRPLSTKERNDKEDEGCVIRRNDTMVELCAPASSFAFKTTSNHSFDDSTHQFTFSHVFPEETTQKNFFDTTMLPFVTDIFSGHNGLVFTYGVTNSGKTYTVQGTSKDGGVIPRSLDVLFNSIANNLYTSANLKPKLCQEVNYLSKSQTLKEEDFRSKVLNFGDKEDSDLTILKKFNSTVNMDATAKGNSFFPDVSVIQKGNSASSIADDVHTRLSDATIVEVNSPSDVKFAMWVSFIEIYNELIHDLLDLTPIVKKRSSLKLGEDKNGNPYVKGVKEVFVTTADEAIKVLRVGQRNRHIAATKLNQQSSRSHAIFSIKLLKIIDGEKPQVTRINRLSIVDLAGSERYSKTDAQGGTLKEASNINCSIMTLGKCISILRYNQDHPNHPTIVPFRESKLTRLFQSYFLGKGKACMIVNISPCASVFDETYNVLKFSSVAKEVKMKSERATEVFQVPPVPKSLFNRTTGGGGGGAPGTPSGQKRIPLCIVTPSTRKERSLKDPTDFTYDELVNLVKELTEKVKKERMEKSKLEQDIRGEFSREMTLLMSEMDETHRQELDDQKESLNQFMEDRLDLLTKTAEKQRKRKRIRGEDSAENESLLANMDSEKIEDLGVVDSKRFKIMEYNFEAMEKKWKEAEETLKMQNQSMIEMQQMLQDKNDEIERLREELDESTGYRNSTKEFEKLEENKSEATSKTALEPVEEEEDTGASGEAGVTKKYSLRNKQATFV